MRKYFYFLFFISSLFSATITTSFDDKVFTGEQYEIVHTICVNTPHNSKLIYDLKGGASFDYNDFKVSGCVWNGSVYECNLSLNAGVQNITHQFNISDFTSVKSLDVVIRLEGSDEDYGVCNAPPKPSKPSSGGSSGGGSFSSPKPTITQEVEKEEEKNLDEEQEKEQEQEEQPSIETPTETPEQEQPPPVLEEETKPTQNSSKLDEINKDNISITDNEEELDIVNILVFSTVIVAGVGAVVVGAGLMFPNAVAEFFSGIEIPKKK